MNNLIFYLFLFFTIPLFAEDSIPLKAELIANHIEVSPGQDFKLIVDIELKSGWHAYWKNPGDCGMAPSIEWQLPEGLEVTATEWPTPQKFENGESITFGYSDQFSLLITMKSSKELKKGLIQIEGNLQWVVCSDETCLPGITPIKTEIKIGNLAIQEDKNQMRFSKVQKALPKDCPQSWIEHKSNSFLISFPQEIAMNDSPKFFPENSNYKTSFKNNEEGLELSLPEGESSLKGILVLGNNSYAVDLQAPKKPSFKEEPLTLIWALIFAFLGGLILNLMPCVLPVVSLKVMSFVKMAKNSRIELIKQGLAFTIGVLTSFWILAAFLVGLQATGKAVGWGFQLQDPLFISALALLFTLLALNLFGVFEIGTSIASIAGSTSIEAEKTGYRSSFLSGMFATAIATPCTGPFMGSALGYALAQPAYVSFLVFSILGLGMSLPYLLIGFFPSLIQWIPKPGAWMESFKQFLGFIMLATVIWLLWVFNGQTSETGLFLLLFSLLMAAIGAWIYGRFGSINRSKSSRKISYWISGLFLFGTLGLAKVASGTISEPHLLAAMNKGWEPFSQEKVAELRKEKKPVLIDFTAKWCLICQANHLVMTHKDVMKKFSENDVTLMKADWTRYDPVITEALKKYGRSGVPLYIYYGDDDEPIILPQVLTPEIVIKTIDKNKASLKTYVR